jgi:hypothetical protein
LIVSKKPIRRRYDAASIRLEEVARSLPRGKTPLSDAQRWGIHEAALDYAFGLVRLLEEKRGTIRSPEEAIADIRKGVSLGTNHPHLALVAAIK